MRIVGQAAFPALLALAAIVAACGPNVSPQVVSWRADESIITPESTAVAPVGGLLVETDTDLVENGGQTYYNVRRPYEVYAQDGHLVRYVDNEGARSGEEPVVAKLPPGRYVVASMVGTVYRRVEVEIRDGQVTLVTKNTLRKARPVFTQIGSR
jgi:hypothetical protein